MLYILGRRPDEFGLVPDRNGFVKYRELLQATHEEPGWHYVRQSHINEVLLGKDRPLFESEGNRIRASERKWRLDLDIQPDSPPNILFTAVRKRAHPAVMEKGLMQGEGRYVILSADEKMALRIGKRRDQKPVLLKVKAAEAQKQGTLFYRFGDLFLTQQIPARFISGPPVSKEAKETSIDAQTRKEKAVPRHLDVAPGTFTLDISRDPDPYRRAKWKKRKGWKEESRKIRRAKPH